MLEVWVDLEAELGEDLHQPSAQGCLSVDLDLVQGWEMGKGMDPE